MHTHINPQKEDSKTITKHYRIQGNKHDCSQDGFSGFHRTLHPSAGTGKRRMKVRKTRPPDANLSSQCTKMHLRWRPCPDPHWGVVALPRPISCINGQPGNNPR